MSRRSMATLGVFLLLLVLGTVALVLPVPYVAMSPGPTVNVLGNRNDRPIIAVSGHRTYPTSGDLRLTTVSVTDPTRQLRLGETLYAWFDRTRAVLPRAVVYPPEQTAQQSQQQGAVEMVSSQDTAIAAALRELGYRPRQRIEVLAAVKGSAAAGRLRVRDQFVEVNGERITKAAQVASAIQRTGVGKPATFVVRRAGKQTTVRVTPEASPQDPKKAVVGIQIGIGYQFPFDVDVRLGDDIGGPSAGLMFSLGIYDRLTPGSLTGGVDIAGTGTIGADGRVGSIGGIQQKIVAATQAGAKLFFVPPGNCEEALHADVTKGDIRLVKAPTMRSAAASLRAYAKDRSATLPSCRS